MRQIRKSGVPSTRRTANASHAGEAALPLPFPVVGLGASAGGIPALERFFANLPGDAGLALVLVMHLDPPGKSLLSEILSRHTAMPVQEVEDGVRVEVNTVYVIPPNRLLTMSGGALRLEPLPMPGALSQPIDRFFRSLAGDQGENAVCVVLSGMGSDGTQGLKEIKGAGGMVLVQDPDTAEYGSMPRSALATGLADLVLPVEEMPGRLREFLSRAKRIRVREGGGKDPGAVDPLRDILRVVRRRLGHDFSHYKPSSVVRRIEKRMLVKGLDSPESYVHFLESDDREVHELFRDLLIGVTGFFRDPQAFESLNRNVLPGLLRDRPENERVRIWIPGCSTGEEAYTLAILLAEHLQKIKRSFEVQIFATDIDPRAIDQARIGSYPLSIAADVSPERLKRFFKQGDERYQVLPSLREMIVFAPHDLLRDPPFFKLDLISCRNLLIYLDADIQKKVLHIFFYSLNNNGNLFLGPSETLGSFADLFHPVDKKWKIFRKNELARPSQVEFPTTPRHFFIREDEPPSPPPSPKLNMAALAERALLKKYAPPAVLINERMDVLHFHGDTGSYLRPPQGTPTSNLLKIARKGLALRLRAASQKAFKTGKPVRLQRLKLLGKGGRPLAVGMDPLVEPNTAKGLMLVTFEESLGRCRPEPAKAGDDLTTDTMVQHLEEELRFTSDQLQNTIEALETSNEELKSSNEELMSMNEELQSSNEELEASKEELQALNEELTTVNSELSGKVEELQQANSDLENLFTSTNVATVFLDKRFTIRRFTPAAATVFNLIRTDVGRPLEHIVNRLDYPGIMDDCRKALRRLATVVREVRAQDGQWYLCRIFPYRTVEDVIDGTVLTLVNISEVKQAQETLASREVELQRSTAERQAILEAAPALVLMAYDRNCALIEGNTLARQLLRVPEGERLSFGGPGEPQARFRFLHQGRELAPEEQPLQVAAAHGVSIRDYLTDILFEGGCVLHLFGNVSPLFDKDGRPSGAVAVFQDVTSLKSTEADLLQAKQRAEENSKAKSVFLANMSHEIRTPLNGLLGMLQLLGRRAPAAERREYLINATMAARSLLALVNDILDLSRVESGKLDLAREPFSIRNELESLMALFEVQVRGKGLTLAHTVSADVPEVLVGDAAKIKQILYNLLGNALKFTERGRVGVRVFASSPEGPDGRFRLGLEVSDTGIGIPEKNLGRIFEPFIRADTPYGRDAEGTGLGLSIVRRLAEAMHGSVSVVSKEGQGTTVTCVVQVHPAGAGSRPVGRRPAAGKGDLRKRVAGMRVLVVDDDRVNVLFLTNVLRDCGIEARVARDGFQALAALEKEPFDLVFLDIQMPHMDGMEAVGRIRAHDGSRYDPRTPVVALTAFALKEEQERFLTAGMDETLTKPVEIEVLNEVLLRHASRRGAGARTKDGSTAGGRRRKK